MNIWFGACTLSYKIWYLWPKHVNWLILLSVSACLKGLWVKPRYQNKSTCFKLHPVQSSRPRSITILWTGVCSDFNHRAHTQHTEHSDFRWLCLSISSTWSITTYLGSSFFLFLQPLSVSHQNNNVTTFLFCFKNKRWWQQCNLHNLSLQILSSGQLTAHNNFELPSKTFLTKNYWAIHINCIKWSSPH